MAATRDIKTHSIAVACDVCGRTLLPGERAEPYLAGGSRRQVCELCTARATHEGWIRESATSAELPASRPRPIRGRSLMGRLLPRPRDPEPRRESRAHAGEEPVVDAPVHTPSPFGDGLAAADPPRHVHAVPTNDDLKAARALELFNAGEHTRTIAGVARSLGTPGVTVRPSHEEPSMVSIVVGWELSWYRFEVDLSDEAGGVRVAGKGYELSELGEHEREWNAAADDRGALAFAL